MLNETIVRFYKRPNVTISELVKPIVTKTIVTTTDLNSVNGFPLQPPSQKLDEWSRYKLFITKNISSWDIDVDENVININSILFTKNN